MAKTKHDTLIPCQPKPQISPAPMVGATAGTSVNTMITNEVTCAISRPENRSRMIAMATTRAPAAPSPCSARAASRVSRVGASQHSAAPTR